VPTLTSDIVEMISDKFNEQKKPIVVVCFGGDYTIAHKRALEHYGIPTFSYPERAVAAVSCLVKHWNNSNTIKN
jgi:acyl-CoA synthetase (NDP forming)